MRRELDTLLTELYVLIDDHVAPARRGRGRRPRLSDSELICLAVAQVLPGFDCERRSIRHLHTDPVLRAMLPYVPRQSGYHKRLKAALPLLCQAIAVIAEQSPSFFDDLYHRRDAGAVRHVAGDREALGAGLARRVRLLRQPFPLLLGVKFYLVCTGDRCR